jgi:hypothetical protein
MSGWCTFHCFFVFPFSHVRPTIKYDQKGPKVVLRVKKIGGRARSTRILLVSQKDISYISQSSHHSFVFFLSSLGLLKNKIPYIFLVFTNHVVEHVFSFFFFFLALLK